MTRELSLKATTTEVELADELDVLAGLEGALAAAPATEQSVVAVVGLGYVGLPTAVALRNAGARVIGLDSSPSRLRAIRAGEAELLSSEQEDLARHLEEESFALTSSPDAISLADLVLICVPTPVDEWRRPDLGLVRLRVRRWLLMRGGGRRLC